MTEESSIHFHVSFTEPQAHYVNVKMTIKGFRNQEYIDVKMPVWTPGSYLIREYARHVEQFAAQSESQDQLEFQKINKNTWRIYNSAEDLVVNYSVYGFETSVRTNHIDDSHAFLSPAATFLHVADQIHHEVTITIDLPKTWTKISTGLQKSESDLFTYYAANFDVLYDAPFELGNQDVWSFDAANVHHEFAMVGPGNYDKDRIARDVTKIVEEETRIWGSNPNDFYVFITHNYQIGSGGLEHLNSTVLGATRSGYNQDVFYKNYLSLVAHEYFHLWLVKRLRPKPLGPFNYDEENYTSLLWIIEGFTAYYDNLITRRCGFRDERDYLQMLALEFNTVYNRPGFEYQSVGLASFDTWIKQYRPDENSANTSISYYNKGAMLAVALDTKIIRETNGLYRLDDVLKAAYTHFYLIEGRGFEEKEFQLLAEEVTGVSLSEIFGAVYSLKELDYNSYFNPMGYELVDLNENNQSLSLGIKTANNDTRILIKAVDRHSGAWHAGLNVNDEIIGVNGYRLDPNGRELEHIIHDSHAGDVIDVLVARDGVLKTIPVTLSYSDKKAYVIQPLENRSEEQRRLGSIWLSL